MTRKVRLTLSSDKDLVPEAEEDAALARFAEEREKSFKRSRAFTHKQVWGS